MGHVEGPIRNRDRAAPSSRTEHSGIRETRCAAREASGGWGSTPTTSALSGEHRQVVPRPTADVDDVPSRPVLDLAHRRLDDTGSVDALVLDLVDIRRVPDVGGGDDVAHAVDRPGLGVAAIVAGCTMSGGELVGASRPDRPHLRQVRLGANRQLLVVPGPSAR